MTKQTNINWIVIGLLLALFIGALDVTIVSTAMPKITAELQGGSLFSWVFTIYTLTTCVATPIFGKLSDLFGRKLVFAIGIILFVASSILCGLSNSMTALIWFRALQGIGAGALNPVCFTIVGDLFTGRKRGKMMGLFSSVWSVAGLLGPLVGGYFVDRVDWRWIFFINVPIGVIALACVAVFLKENFQKQKKRIDYMGAAAFTVSISSLMYALLSGGEKYAWDSAVIVLLFVVSAVFLMLFLWIESRSAEPMIPLAIFRDRALTVSNVSGFLAFTISSGVTIYAPLWIQDVLGHLATSSGLMVMPMSIAWPLASNVVGRMMYKIGAKASVVTGAFIVVAGAAWLTALEIGSPYGYWVCILSLIGFGMGFIVTPTTVIVQSSVGWELRGVATSTISLLRSLGQTVGVAVFGTIYNHYVTGENPAPSQMVSGMHGIFVLMIAIALAHAASVFFLPGSRSSAAHQPSS